LYNIFAGNKHHNGDTYSVKRVKEEVFTAHPLRVTRIDIHIFK
jgi:hypothetical protein